MPGDTPATDAADAVSALRVAGVPETLGYPAPDPGDVAAVGDGVNDVYAVPVGDERVVVKFATYSTADHLRAGVAAARVLRAYTDLPVPAVHAFAEDPVDLPPFVVLDRRPGDPLAADFADPRVRDPDAVSLLGAVLRRFGSVPERATAGYGSIDRFDRRRGGPRVVATHENCGDWLVDYGTRYLRNPADHDALAAVAPRAADYLRAERDRLPAAPEGAIVLTDCSPGNLLAPDGVPPASVDGVTGVVDLERAKVGPLAFAAVNAEYLLTRDAEDPDAVRAALYDRLPFGPAVDSRELYRVIAVARSAAALPAWYDTGSERFRERGDAVADELARLVG